MNRELTIEERKAVARVKRAIKALPPTIGLYFHGDSASVLDWPSPDETRGDETLDSFPTPQCKAGDF